jgi:hypothetical protein
MMRGPSVLLLLLCLVLTERCNGWGVSFDASLNPPSASITAEGSAEANFPGVGKVGGTFGGSVTANEDGITDTVTVDASASGGLLDAAKGTFLEPLIDRLTHVSGTYNIPSGPDLLTIYQSLYKCDPEEPLTCLQSIAEATLGNCSYIGTDLTNCAVIMEQVCSTMLHVTVL